MAAKKLKGSIPVKTGKGSLPMKKRHGARWEKPKVPLWQQHATRKYARKKPMDLCKVMDCDHYAVGCEPLTQANGNRLRILQRTSEERYCQLHHPNFRKRRSESLKATFAKKGICKGVSRREMPMCATGIRPGRKKRSIGIDLNVVAVLPAKCFYTPSAPGIAVDAKWKRTPMCRFVKGTSTE